MSESGDCEQTMNHISNLISERSTMSQLYISPVAKMSDENDHLTFEDDLGVPHSAYDVFSEYEINKRFERDPVANCTFAAVTCCTRKYLLPLLRRSL